MKDRLSPAGWQLPPARNDLHLQLFSFISTISYTSINDSPIWLIQDKVCKGFRSKDVWNVIRPAISPVPWAPLVWNPGITYSLIARTLFLSGGISTASWGSMIPLALGKTSSPGYQWHLHVRFVPWPFFWVGKRVFTKFGRKGIAAIIVEPPCHTTL